MDVKEWLFRQGMTKTDFCAFLGINRQYFHQILSGKRRASKKLADKIRKFSDNAISYSSLRPYKDRPKKTKRKI